MHLDSQMGLEKIGVGMISQFPLDCMHLVDLGITKKILTHILTKKTINPISRGADSSMTALLETLKPFIPREFARKPRGFKVICRWKATEYRQFGLYTGIIVLKDFIPKEIYNHFLLLHCAYKLLLMSRNHLEIKKAHEMLTNFVELFPVLYGRTSVSYNVHNLLHLADCVLEYGKLNNFSAYVFENYMKTLKKKIKMPKHLPQQTFNQFSKDPFILKKKFYGIKKRKNVLSLFTPKGLFSSDCPDNICLVGSQCFIKITKILGKTKFSGKMYLNVQNFFEYPMNSLDLEIGFIGNELFSEETIYNVKDILAKVAKLPYLNGFVFITETHSLSV